MTEQRVTIRPATREDLPGLQPVIQRAYRGDSARRGWTHEADLLDDVRIDLASLEKIIGDPATRLLVALDGETPIGCVQVTGKGVDKNGGLAYLGLLCVEPDIQASGIGRQLMSAAESCARQVFDADAIEMTVIEQRAELIAYYERRGYARSGGRRDFPVAVEPPLFMTVLVKPLA
jgi:predicted N-acetyltransferase YhbS